MNRRDFLKVATTSPALVAVSQSSTSTTSPLIVPPSADLSRLLDCIAQVESRRDDKAISYRGSTPIARGRYQLKCDTWFQHTNRPWTLAHNFFFADEVARRHLGWLHKNIPPSSPREPSFHPWALAWAWRGGLTGWQVRDTFPDEVVRQYNDYADRVVNLYNDVSP